MRIDTQGWPAIQLAPLITIIIMFWGMDGGRISRVAPAIQICPHSPTPFQKDSKIENLEGGGEIRRKGEGSGGRAKARNPVDPGRVGDGSGGRAKARNPVDPGRY